MNEQWKPIDGFDQYEVSDQGRVRHEKRILHPRKDSHGYFRVGLYKGKKRKWLSVHRLVASAFIENTDGLPEVNHMDENPMNNSVSNLEWCSRIYNVRYGTGIERNSEKHKKPVKCIETSEVFSSAIDAERITGIDHSSIHKCVVGKLHTSGGYHWTYAE